MAGDLVLNTITNLASLYQDEVKLSQFVNRERKKLQSSLATIQSVLEDAERKQLANKSSALDEWLQKLKDAVFDLEDILDDCKTESIRDEYEGDRSCAFLGFLHPQKLMFRRNISGRMKTIRERLDVIAQEKEQFFLEQLAERQPDTNLNNIPRWRQTISIVTEDEVFGRDEDMEIIVRHLLEDAGNADTVYVYPIVGLGGLGKTTLAQLVYGDPRVIKHFQEKKWICVSDNFDLTTLLKAITKSEQSSDDLDELAKKLQDMLQWKKYLVVLDDVWNDDPEKWMNLRNLLACGARGSAVLVTTRLEKVAMMMRTPSAQPYHLTALSEDDCWQVFRKRAFGPCIVQETDNLVSVGKDIARKCRGVPLAAKTLGGLLMFEGDEKSWANIRDSELWILTEKQGSILAALRLSYLNLPLRDRRCFSFCSIFPKDYTIDTRYLIYLWMANDLIYKGQSEELELEDIGEKVVKELYWRSLIQDVVRYDDTGSIICFKMHDLVHDLAKSVSNHESYVVEKPSSAHISSGTRHLSIACFGIESRDAYNLLVKIESLRSFLFSSNRYSVDLDMSHLLKHTKLRALDLSGFYGVTTKLPSSINVLRHLRYLNLSWSKIIELPDSIGDLWNLQTLDVTFCEYLKSFPVSIGRLKNLRHLYDRGCDGLSYMPQSMVGLTSLRTLEVVVVGELEEELFPLSGLGHLKYLGGELEIKFLGGVRDAKVAEKANLKEKHDLHTLRLLWFGGNDNGVANQQEQIHILEALQPSPMLRNLHLFSYEGMGFSNWLMNELPIFKYIQSLILLNCENCTRLPPLWRLPSLKSLMLLSLSSVRYLIESGGQECVSFTTLEYLEISDLPSLNKIMSGEEAGQQVNDCIIFPRLSELNITSCPVLKCYDAGPPPSLRSLTLLKCERIMLSMFFYASYHLQSLPSLKNLRISSCDSLESLPDQMFRGMSSLQDLSIESCSKLKSLENLKSLRSLTKLTIAECPEVNDISNVILHLTSLQYFRLSGWHLKSLDIDTLMDLPSLKCLELEDCPNLESLPNWMIGLVSLEEFRLESCPGLTTLPDSIQRLSKLKKLYIKICPRLMERYQKETGQDWHKIAHIPDIKIEDW